MRLTVVVPVYKEHSRLLTSLKNVADFAETANGGEVDVVFVDDGSPDNCSGVVNAFIADREEARMQLLRYEKNRGKGYAVKTGMMAAKGDLILMSDADLSTPLNDWVKLKTAIDAGADMACGSRRAKGAHVGVPPPWHRRLLSVVFNWLVHLAGVRKIRDTQCGFKLFRAEVAKELFKRLRTNRFAFDVELIATARDLGYRVVEIPVEWNYSGHSTVRLLSSGSRMMWDVFKLAVRRLLFGRFV